MNVLGSFLGTCLLSSGLLVFLYSTIPPTAWIGILFFATGLVIILEVTRIRVMQHGLKGYLPAFLNEYITRTDLVDLLVRKLRENGAISKMFRLMLIKWVDLSREEIVEVLGGIWSGFGELSREGRLISLAPAWFKRIYSPEKSVDAYDAVLDSSTRLDPSESFDSADIHKFHVMHHAVAETDRRYRHNHDLTPLLLWLAENRIRHAMAEGLPLIRKQFLKASIPALVFYMMWCRVPRSRNSLRILFFSLLSTYAVSVTKGLPASAEVLFKLVHFSAYRKRGSRPLVTNQSTGSVKALLYALVEPFLPIVNEPHSCTVKPHVPHSPALSQASTLDQTVMLS